MQLLKGDAGLVGVTVLEILENDGLSGFEHFLVAEHGEVRLQLNVPVVHRVAVVVGVVRVHVLLGQFRTGLAPHSLSSGSTCSTHKRKFSLMSISKNLTLEKFYIYFELLFGNTLIYCSSGFCLQKNNYMGSN